MNTIAWLMIISGAVLARFVVRGRAANIGGDLSDLFLAAVQGDTAAVQEVIMRKGESVTDPSGGRKIDYKTPTDTTDDPGKVIKGDGWTLDKHLNYIVNDVKKKFPGIVVGTIGDAAHRARKSDHNPDSKGVVHAADFMIGGSFSASDADTLSKQLATTADPAVKYVIYNRRIWENGVWRKYTGSDPHTNHVHLSVR